LLFQLRRVLSGFKSVAQCKGSSARNLSADQPFPPFSSRALPSASNLLKLELHKSFVVGGK
jgi:hypothetical protein